jgi:uncharacterized protein
MTRIKLGARWDALGQNGRFARAVEHSLVDYAEINVPCAADDWSSELGLPVLAHTSLNPLASACGIPEPVARGVKALADAMDSPWIGEHLSWLSPEATGALGYVFTPFALEELVEQAAHNVRCLRAFYGRPIALELAPVYSEYPGCSSEIELLNDVARRSDSGIIVDLAHLVISNRNLQRPIDYGLDLFDSSRVVELHVAGMRKSRDARFWHDAHGLVPGDDVVRFAGELARAYPNLKAVTLEHSADAPEADFFASLDRLRAVLS